MLWSESDQLRPRTGGGCSEKIEQVLADTDRLVSTLESDEAKAAKQSS